MKHKIEEITFLRGISILGIVLLHVTAYFLVDSLRDNPIFKVNLVLNQLVRYSLPMFIVISGFSLTYSDNLQGELAFSDLS